MRSLKIDQSKFSVNLVGYFPIGAGFIATHINDDEVCEAIINAAHSQPIVVYVELQGLPSGEILVSNIRTTPEYITQPPQPSTQGETYQDAAGETDYFVGTSSAHMDDPSDLGGNNANLPYSENVEYETMPSGDSSDDDDNEYIDSERVDLRAAEPSHAVRDLITDYSMRTSHTEERLIRSNDYVRSAQSTKEWDEDIVFDGPSDDSTFEGENSIPDELVESMCFHDKKQLQFAVQGWSIINNVEYVIYASSQSKFTALCTRHSDPVRPCQWRLHACSVKRLGGTWRISSVGSTHSCTHSVLNAGHRQCTSQFISYFIHSAVRRQLDLKPREIVGRMKSKFNIRVSYMKAWDARRKAVRAIFGSWEESYRSLARFMAILCKVMPGSVYRVNPTTSNTFQRLFWSFEPSIRGWHYCRSVLCFDGTFLLGKYRGTLLTAVGIDANNGLFPLAFAVVESECIESWLWFLRTLQDLIPLVSTRPDLCLISDRHAGLVRGCRDVFPWAADRFCLRHLRENFKKAVRQLGIADVEFMCKKMYVAGNTDDIRIFKRHMTDIRNIKQEAYDWLAARDFEQWTLTHDNGFRYGTMTTNAAECFNGVLKRARGLPIQALITAVYYNIVSFFMKRLDTATELGQQQGNLFTPRIKATLLGNEHEARRFPEPIRISTSESQVFDVNSRTYKVELSGNNDCTCTCRQPQSYHLPCAHVIAVLGQRHINHIQYVSAYYSLQNYVSTYQGEFHVIPDREEWADHIGEGSFETYNPPNIKRKSGRPRTNKFKNTMDENMHTRSRSCTVCKIIGHNRSTCPQLRPR